MSSRPQLSSSRWLRWYSRSADPALRLVCLPYAGGTAAFYGSWRRAIPSSIELGAVELPGHGLRRSEAVMTELARLVESLVESCRVWHDIPLVLFGHSMGALIAFELALYLERRLGIQVASVILSGASPLPRAWPKPISAMSDAELLAGLHMQGRADGSVFDRFELLEVGMSALRGDLELCRLHRGCYGAKLSAPLTVLGGSEDELVPVDALEHWRACTTNHCSISILPGSHFFLVSQRARTLAVVESSLQRTLDALTSTTGGAATWNL